MNYVKPARWISLEGHNLFDHKLFMLDEKTGYMGSCILKKDGTIVWTHPLASWNGVPAKPTHYWSF